MVRLLTEGSHYMELMCSFFGYCRVDVQNVKGGQCAKDKGKGLMIWNSRHQGSVLCCCVSLREQQDRMNITFVSVLVSIAFCFQVSLCPKNNLVTMYFFFLFAAMQEKQALHMNLMEGK